MAARSARNTDPSDVEIADPGVLWQGIRASADLSMEIILSVRSGPSWPGM
jgi:hypothetical protein